MDLNNSQVDLSIGIIMNFICTRILMSGAVGKWWKPQCMGCKLGISKIPLCMNIHNMYKNYGDASQIRCKYYAKNQRVTKKKITFLCCASEQCIHYMHCVRRFSFLKANDGNNVWAELNYVGLKTEKNYFKHDFESSPSFPSFLQLWIRPEYYETCVPLV